MSRRRRGRPVPVGRSVSRVLRDLGLGETAAVARLAECWDRAVGPEIAARCRPVALRGRRLEAVADSSASCQELRLRQREILAALRRELGDDAPTDLWLRIS